MSKRAQSARALTQRELERGNRRQLAAEAEQFDGVRRGRFEAASLAERVLKDDRRRGREVVRERGVHLRPLAEVRLREPCRYC
jgi:hypothetical protein